MKNNTSPDTRIELVTQEDPVNWLSPGQLLQTGLRAGLASAVGGFSDARLMQAALQPAHSEGCTTAEPTWRAPTTEALWIDYLADTGDGWHGTYSVAWSISQAQLDVGGAGALPRGAVLLLGGDQVYPTPAGEAYRTRFLDPFRSALPAEVPPVNDPADPHLFAIPGNHDWYDGLRGFIQTFCSGQWIGRWQTLQRRSYYALELPHGWWIWGLDLQLESQIDRPQHDYFSAMAAQLQPGQRVVLCAPEPSWLDESVQLHRSDAPPLDSLERMQPRFRSLRDIETLVTRSGARVAAVLAGDLHHYARYHPVPPEAAGASAQTGAAASAPPQRITCGGGGAFLLGTHHLPKELRFRSGAGVEQHQLAATFPAKADSQALRNRAWRLPMHNPTFGALLGSIYLLLWWLLQSASVVPGAGGGIEASLMVWLAQVPIGWSGLRQATDVVINLLLHSPTAALYGLLVMAAGAAFTGSSTGSLRTRRQGALAGALHGLLHVQLAIWLLWAAAALNLAVLAPLFGLDPLHWAASPWHALLVATEALLAGGVAGGLLFGVWLVLANKVFRWHDQEVFSCQAIADYRSFLRMCIDADALTIYPLGIRRACRSWRVGRGIEVLRQAGSSWRLRVSRGAGARFEPAEPLQVELIEPPIVIR
ncbi:MAG: hypothetical protein RLY71_3820 [Pseudomonadota bacterium]|jgi:hypothetical protein